MCWNVSLCEAVTLIKPQSVNELLGDCVRNVPPLCLRCLPDMSHTKEAQRQVGEKAMGHTHGGQLKITLRPYSHN